MSNFNDLIGRVFTGKADRDDFESGFPDAIYNWVSTMDLETTSLLYRKIPEDIRDDLERETEADTIEERLRDVIVLWIERSIYNN